MYLGDDSVGPIRIKLQFRACLTEFVTKLGSRENWDGEDPRRGEQLLGSGQYGREIVDCTTKFILEIADTELVSRVMSSESVRRTRWWGEL